jgi:hypothetical protein
MNHKPKEPPSRASLGWQIRSLVFISILALCSSGLGQETVDGFFQQASNVALDWNGLSSVATLQCEHSAAIKDTNSLSVFACGNPASVSDASPIATFLKAAFELSEIRSHGSQWLGDDDRGEKIEAALKTETRLARVTVYWPGEGGDNYTRRRQSSSGVRLRDGHCAVDPQIIPYGSVVKIPGMGRYVAVDTGSAVVARRAARAAGRTPDERNALVVDLYCSSRAKAREIEANAEKFALVTWYRE